MATEPRIGNTIKRARERLRMTQADVADALGVSRAAVNAWETDRAYPRSSIGALEQLLGVSLDTGQSETIDQALDRLEREIAELRGLREEGKKGHGNDDENGGTRRAG